MKIIAVSNFNIESIADILVAENVKEYYGKKIVDFLNGMEGPDSTYFYKLVPDDHKLWRGMEELI